MKKILLSLFAFLTVFGSFYLLTAVSADTQGDINTQLNAAAGSQGAGYGEAQDPRLTFANIVRTALEVLGVLLLALNLYAGFLWMTAGGNEDKVTKAKSLLFQAVVGLVIILSAYAITQYVIKIALGKWTDYQNQYYIDPPKPFECGVEVNGTECPPNVNYIE